MKTSFVLSHTNLIFVNSYSFSDYKKLFGSDIYSLLFYFYLCMLIVFIIATERFIPSAKVAFSFKITIKTFKNL